MFKRKKQIDKDISILLDVILNQFEQLNEKVDRLEITISDFIRYEPMEKIEAKILKLADRN